ncbi:MAG: hypothetical protein H6Q07_3544, partial [Acidobacteria bacterium]|nr:hypothetical protein [Acidobacteriota bacterium]
MIATGRDGDFITSFNRAVKIGGVDYLQQLAPQISIATGAALRGGPRFL